MLDNILSWVNIVLPTAFGVVCAVQALKPPKAEHHTRWIVAYILAGLLGSGAVRLQQYSAEKQAATDRQELQNHITQLQQEVTRSRLPIKDVLVSFRVDVPLDHPALNNYRERLEKCVQQMVATQELKCGARHKTVDISGNPARLRDFCIQPGTELFPTEKKDPLPYRLLDQVTLGFRLFKSAAVNGQQLNDPAAADLTFAAIKVLDRADNSTLTSTFVTLCYDIETKTLYLSGSDVPVQGWTSNGKISSIPDLSEVTIAVYPVIIFQEFEGKGSALIPSDRTVIASEISRNVSLKQLQVGMSGGYFFDLPLDKFTLVKDVRGFPIYVTLVGQINKPFS